MYWDYPESEEAYNVPNQFRFGSELIVSPITQPRDSVTHLGAEKLWLPAGRYVDIFTGIIYNRAGELTVHRPLNFTPVLAKEGSIVPLDAAYRPKSGSPNPTGLEVLLVVGADGSFTIIEDDGTGHLVDDGGFSILDDEGVESNEETVRFAHTPITYKQSTGVIKIGPTSPANDAIPKSREWRVRLLAHTPSHGSEIRCFTTAPSTKSRASPLKHSIETKPNGTLLTLAAVPTGHAIHIELGSSPQLDVIDPNPKLWDIIDKAWIEMDKKWDYWNCVNNPEPVLNKVRALQGRGVRKELLDAMLELLLADERYAGDVGRDEGF
jgi:hypothetical protein